MSHPHRKPAPDRRRAAERSPLDAEPPAAESTPEALAALRERLSKAHTRAQRRAERIQSDIARMDAAEVEAARAPAFVPVAKAAKRGAREIEAFDYATGEPMRLAIDPSRPALESVQAIFDRARRMRRGRPVAEKRATETAREIAAIDLALRELASADEAFSRTHMPIDPAAWASWLRALPRTHPRAARKRSDGERQPFRLFRTASGLPVLIGREGKDNDELTFRVARPHHAWLHARGVPGAHVIVVLPRARVLTPDELVDAAHLAAHFSKNRGEREAEIAVADRRYVHRIRGAAPGRVRLEREKTVFVKIEVKRLERLLASEDESRPGDGVPVAKKHRR